MKRVILLCALAIITVAAILPAKQDTTKTYAQTKAYTAANNCSKLCLQIASVSDWKHKQDLFVKARLAYKQAEPYLEYFQYTHVVQYINGAPLPKLEAGVPGVSYLTPEGFQFLEEAFCKGDTAEVNRLANTLSIRLNALNGRLMPEQKIYDRDVLESSRNALLRLMSLGITGFDTPCISNAHEESFIVWQSIASTVQQFVISKQLPKETVENINQYIEEGKKHFKDSSFDNFNRATFLRDALLPLYKHLVEVQKGLGVEFYDEVDQIAIPVNRRSEKVFSSTFFNKQYFLNVASAQFNESHAKLGKLLFYDPILSGNNKRSCNSCHKPDLAFADGKTRALSYNKVDTLKRNTPHLLDAIYAKSFFWDTRADEIGVQIEHVIENEHEFNTDYLALIERLKTCPDYVQMFQEAYSFLPGDMQVSKHTINQSLAAYVANLSSFSTPFDAYVNGQIATVSKDVEHGFNLFMGKAACGTCHFAPSFSGLVPPYYAETETEVLGIPAMGYPSKIMSDTDEGRYDSGIMANRAPHYKNAFKTPTVRNSAKTAPYMHNGSMQDLETVVDFYNKGGGVGLGFEIDNQTLPFDSLSLSKEEQKAIVAFLEALTDSIVFNKIPTQLPLSTKASLNDRKVGGEY